MRRAGFEALFDGTLLITVLLVAGTLTLSLSAPRPADPRGEGLRLAEDTRLALLRTSASDFGYAANGTWVALPDGTTVETVLRLEVHLRRVPGLDFTTANARIESICARLLPTAWAGQLTAHVAGDTVLRIPRNATVPSTRFASAWTYPSLDGSADDTRLAVTVWLSPPR